MTTIVSNSLRTSGWCFYIDRGGTFTDIVARDPDGNIVTQKILSEHNDEAAQDSAVMGIKKVLGLSLHEKIPDHAITEIRVGTTIATNALLERKGEGVLLVINHGFADLLAIGTQNRPDIFARAIHKIPPLYSRVLEVAGRMSACGNELEPLDLDAAERGLARAYNEGLCAVAIVLLHSHKYPGHEQSLAKVAERVGFKQISLSSVVDPLQKIVQRGDTTVVDAYLSPVLNRYINRLKQSLDKVPRILFMQSNGGLAHEAHFSGKNSLLSGPAGGLIGAQRVAQNAGIKRFISFDMGGTSTDVALYDGQGFDRINEAHMAGIRVRTPLYAIHTVASGGGSICQSKEGRLTVGPISAGARPGPAAYGHGGPLTITDCHLFLGHLQSKYFPAVFGDGGNDGLDVLLAKASLLEIQRSIYEQRNLKMSLEEIAQGFIRIADEHMAQAIRQISVQRGQNPADHVLVCFGGAGGQHACGVAEALGIDNVLIHPWSGVLSAYGIGCANLRFVQLKSVDLLLNAITLLELEPHWSSLKDSSMRRMAEQGASITDVILHRRFHLRYQGSDTELLIDDAAQNELTVRFSTMHRQKFGFDCPGRLINIAAIEMEAITKEDDFFAPLVSKTLRKGSLVAKEKVPFFDADRWHKVELYQASEIELGDEIEGPAVVVDPHATVVLKANWKIERGHDGSLWLRKQKTTVRPLKSRTVIDPIHLEIFNGRFQAIAEQMGVTLAKTAQSVNIKERLDFSCAIFDAQGNLVANAPHVPVHLGSMDASVKSIINQFGAQIRPGNVYALNDPYSGGTHLPDITVITPIFDKMAKSPAFFVASRGHHADVGGISPGSMPPHSQTINEEGIWFTNFILVENGSFKEAQFRAFIKRSLSCTKSPTKSLGHRSTACSKYHWCRGNNKVA